MYDKEEIYDTQISPLVAKIIEICERERIPTAMQFYIKEAKKGTPIFCTTFLPFESESEGYKQIERIGRAMYY